MRENRAAATAVVTAIQEADELLTLSPAEGADLYAEAEPTKLPALVLTEMVKQATWTTVPHGVMANARFMQTIGMLKAAPARWQDVFFEPSSAGPGD